MNRLSDELFSELDRRRLQEREAELREPTPRERLMAFLVLLGVVALLAWWLLSPVRGGNEAAYGNSETLLVEVPE